MKNNVKLQQRSISQETVHWRISHVTWTDVDDWWIKRLTLEWRTFRIPCIAKNVMNFLHKQALTSTSVMLDWCSNIITVLLTVLYVLSRMRQKSSRKSCSSNFPADLPRPPERPSRSMHGKVASEIKALSVCMLLYEVRYLITKKCKQQKTWPSC